MATSFFPEGIDLVAYINLGSRSDRRQEIEKEFSRLQIPEGKILRWQATRHTNGALGCTMSHIALLEHIMTLPDTVQTILILEDDFNFVDDVALVNESLTELLQYPRDRWEIALLSYVVSESLPLDALVSISLFSQGTAGYLVNRTCVELLLANFKEGRDLLISSRIGYRYSLDIYWWKFMQGRKCLYFNKPLGYQRKSYSNITGKIKLSQSYTQTRDLTENKG